MSLPRLALAVGDPAGIGPGIGVKAAADAPVREVGVRVPNGLPAGEVVAAGMADALAHAVRPAARLASASRSSA